MRIPDLIGQTVELGQVLLTVPHLAAPPFGVDRKDLVQILGCDIDAVEVQLLLPGAQVGSRRTDSDQRVVRWTARNDAAETGPVDSAGAHAAGLTAGVHDGGNSGAGLQSTGGERSHAPSPG